MSLSRRNPRRDAVEREIVNTLERCGWSVMRVSIPGAPDLVCGRAGTLLLLEVKSRTGELTPEQVRWRQRWNGPEPITVRTVDDVLALMRTKG